MSKRLLFVACLGVLALTGQASAQFYGVGFYCGGHRGGYGVPAGAPYVPAAAPFVPAAAPYFPAAAPYFPAAAPYMPAAAPYVPAAAPYVPPPAAPPAAPPGGNGDLVTAINNLTAAIHELAGKMPSDKAPPKSTKPATPGTGGIKDVRRAPSAEQERFDALVAEADALRRGEPVARDGRARLEAALAAADQLRAAQGRTVAAR
ncbi:MAG TPA: hypothetical protein VM597_37475 [Gemmataceae bacterium]|nr:hypothetical protein [Gemmataceae bacterium]